MKIRKNFFIIFIEFFAILLLLVFSYYIIKSYKNNSINIVKIVRCDTPVVKNVEYSIVGVSDKTGSEYIYDFVLQKNEILKSVFKLYKDDWGTDNFHLNRLFISFPIDKDTNSSLFELPPQYEILLDNQKLSLKKKEEQRASKKYIFYGYEYQGLLDDGRYIHLPYFDLLGWETKEKKEFVPITYDFKNLYFIGKGSNKSIKTLPSWIKQQPWIIEKHRVCYNQNL